MNLKGRHFLKLLDYTPEEIQYILDLAAGCDVVVKSGAWYAYEGNKIGQGRENAKQFLKDNPVICTEIETKIRDLFDLDSSVADSE